MKLSNDTIKILKNYATINNNMVFTKGNVLRTISSAKTIYSVSKITEEFPIDFAIYDLPSTLAMLSCLDNPDVICHENNIEIVSDKGLFEVYYCNLKLITVPPQKEVTILPVYTFNISSDEFQTMMKAVSVTGSPSLTIKCDGENVVMKANDRKNETSSSYTKDIGKFDKKFDVHVAVENLKLIQDGYEITVGLTESKASTLLYFKSDSKNVEYWIACGIGSKA